MGRPTLNVDSILPWPGVLDRRKQEKASSHQQSPLSAPWSRHKVSSCLMFLLPSQSCHGGLHPPNFGTKQSFHSTSCFCHVLWQRCGRLYVIVYSVLCMDVYQRAEHFYPIAQTQTRVFWLPYNPLSVSSYDILCSETTTSLTLTLNRFLSYTARACLICVLFSFT